MECKHSHSVYLLRMNSVSGRVNVFGLIAGLAQAGCFVQENCIHLETSIILPVVPSWVVLVLCLASSLWLNEEMHRLSTHHSLVRPVDCCLTCSSAISIQVANTLSLTLASVCLRRSLPCTCIRRASSPEHSSRSAATGQLSCLGLP